MILFHQDAHFYKWKPVLFPLQYHNPAGRFVLKVCPKTLWKGIRLNPWTNFNNSFYYKTNSMWSWIKKNGLIILFWCLILLSSPSFPSSSLIFMILFNFSIKWWPKLSFLVRTKSTGCLNQVVIYVVLYTMTLCVHIFHL